MFGILTLFAVKRFVVLLKFSLLRTIMRKKHISKILKTIFSLLLGIFIVWWLYRETNIKEFWAVVKSGNFWIIGFSLIFGLAGNVLRGLRWEIFFNSLGYKPKRASIIYATLGNYAVNFLLPRAGDIWRCGVVARYDKIPFAKTLETYLIDKIMDLSAGVFLLVSSLVLYIDFFIDYFNRNPSYKENLLNLIFSPWMYLGILVLIVLTTLLFTVFKDFSPIKKLRDFGKTILHDLKLILAMKAKKRIIFYTILIWLLFYLYFYTCFYAFDFTKNLGFLAGWIVFSMSNLGVAVPVQGGLGAWHFMVITSLVILGVTYEEASAFAGAVFTIQSVWIILCGVFGILALPHVKREPHSRDKDFEPEKINS